MFNPQQQQLLHFQQILQTSWPSQPHGIRSLQAVHQQQLLNLQATSQATLLNANPMLQQALLLQHMQGNVRGFNINSPALQQIFPLATGPSLLGSPPMGISMKTPRLSFPFQLQNRMYQKNYQKIPDWKREMGQKLSWSKGSGEREQGKPKGENSRAVSESKENTSSAKEGKTGGEGSEGDDPEPALKKLKSSEEEADVIAADSPEQEPAMICLAEGNAGIEETGSSSEKRRVSLESKISEVPGVGSSLKVTIQQSSESRAISTAALKPGHKNREMGSTNEARQHIGPMFYCYICKSNCSSQQIFQSHMATAEHQQRFLEIQDISNACLVTLLPTEKKILQTFIDPDGTKRLLPQRWCNTCQLNFSGDLIKHRRTQEHKLAKRALRPFCTVCSRHFKTPRKFVEHMKSPEHKQKAQEAKLGEKEPEGPEDSDELITVDAVGCFEDDDDDEGNSEEEDTDYVFPDDKSVTKAITVKELPLQGCEENEEYSLDTVYGLDFVVPVTGYLCRLCHKFYPRDSAARLAHCKSWMHFQNIQKYKAAKNQGTASHLQSFNLALTDESNPLTAIQPQTEMSPLDGVEEISTTALSASEKAAHLLEVPNSENKSPASDEMSGVLVIDNMKNGIFSTNEDPNLQDAVHTKGIPIKQSVTEGQANSEIEETQNPAHKDTLEKIMLMRNGCQEEKDKVVARRQIFPSICRRSSRRKNI
ncbi:cip1-interacting zinc finger protein isoform X2 [Rhinatrema bivittatum]|uniref:cip1-interacting zinc finger protein isoform X2 n=1 Tax=Rhinatrema bivittatum TaxID=194408 RepID=UPI00112947F3|nr:cip1-interacting zinc finger protein isoform X2 [Rhinatrema bivittatum]